MKKLLILAFIIVLAIGGRAEAVNVLINGDFSIDDDETGWVRYDDNGGDWSMSGGMATLSISGSAGLMWYQVIEIPVGVEATVSADWSGNMVGGCWWTEVMLFTFEDAFADDTTGLLPVCERTMLEAGFSQPWTIITPDDNSRPLPYDPFTSDGNDGDGGMAFKKDAWGQNQPEGVPVWDLQNAGLSSAQLNPNPVWPPIDGASAAWRVGPSVTSMGDVVVVMNMGGCDGAVGSVSYDNVELDIDMVPIPGDADLSGTVDDDDVARMAANWQKTGSAVWVQGDFNGDGNVDDLDATILATNYGSSAAAVPEPSMLAVLIGGMLALVFLRRRR